MPKTETQIRRRTLPSIPPTTAEEFGSVERTPRTATHLAEHPAIEGAA